MKIEQRDNSVLISHQGLTVFANKLRSGSYTIKVTSRLPDGQTWVTSGVMEVSKEDFEKWQKLLAHL